MSLFRLDSHLLLYLSLQTFRHFCGKIKFYKSRSDFSPIFSYQNSNKKFVYVSLSLACAPIKYVSRQKSAGFEPELIL